MRVKSTLKSRLQGKTVKDDERYVVTDNSELQRLVVSETVLRPGQATTGHWHGVAEEVYTFLSGSGRITVGEKKYFVCPGAVITIPAGQFHRVKNMSREEDLVFICVFEKYGDRGA